MSKKKNGKLKWVPWSRYALLLSVDGKSPVLLGRFRRREMPSREAERLCVLRGYVPSVFDTRREEIIWPGLVK